MSRQIPKPGEYYRHFKDKMYEIVTVAEHSETGEKLVIYRALYGDFRDYARPLSMFMSEVDKEKYPEADQQYRFEKVGDRVNGFMEEPTKESRVAAFQAVGAAYAKRKTETEAEEEHVEAPLCEDDPEVIARGREILMEFLNVDSCVDRIEILRSRKKEVTNKLIDDIAVVMDLTIHEGPVEDRLRELTTCLKTLSRYDGRRLR